MAKEDVNFKEHPKSSSNINKGSRYNQYLNSFGGPCDLIPPRYTLLGIPPPPNENGFFTSILIIEWTKQVDMLININKRVNLNFVAKDSNFLNAECKVVL